MLKKAEVAAKTPRTTATVTRPMRAVHLGATSIASPVSYPDPPRPTGIHERVARGLVAWDHRPEFRVGARTATHPLAALCAAAPN